MRKSTKLAILVAALVALCSIAALAADTWKQEGDQWFCYDKDGNVIYGDWRKSGSNWYYLDDATGAMVTNKLIQTNDSEGVAQYYWCGEDGARVYQKWVQVPDENSDDGFQWMFFRPLTGKAYYYDKKSGKANAAVTVKNAEGVSRKYLFDENGYMLWGYLDESLTQVTDPLEAAYYYRTKDEGWQFSDWMTYKDGVLGGDYEEATLLYMYFKNSVKVTPDHEDYDEVKGFKVSTGKYYYFDENGVLLTGWQNKKKADKTYYLGAADDGLLKKKMWIKSSSVDPEGTEGWTYLDAEGAPIAAGESGAKIKKINGKYYCFSDGGILLTGAVVLNNPDDLDPENESIALVKDSFKNVKEFKEYPLDYANGDRIYFFSTDDADCSMKSGAQTFTIDDEEVTAYFDKHGFALEGIVSSKIYNNGVLQAAGDQKYIVAKSNKDNSYALVNGAGSILKNTKGVDADGIWWVTMEKEDDTDVQEIFKFADREYAATAATKWKNGDTTFRIGNQWYLMEIVEAKAGDGYKFVSWSKCEAPE